ncbi:MAG: ComEA family DNA-binding protein [Pseudolysinimonas sp.]
MSTAPVPDVRRARVRVGAGAALILVLVGVACAVLVTAVTPHGVSDVVRPSSAAMADTPDASGASVIYVHILGQVAHPGLYALRDGDRGVDIVAAAGGFTAEADPAGINLARFLTDGEQIVVPAVGDVGGGPAGTTGDGLVNLNTADAALLDTLPRIGPAIAQRIIDWREKNGSFASVDDLLDVPGIGDAILEGLRDLVTT